MLALVRITFILGTLTTIIDDDGDVPVVFQNVFAVQKLGDVSFSARTISMCTEIGALEIFVS